LWVTDDDLRGTLGDSASRDDGKLLTDPAFDTCVPTQPTVLGTVETRVPDTQARSAVVADSPDTGSPGTSVTPTLAVTRPVATTAGKKVAASTAKPQPATATTPTTPTTASTTTTSSTTTEKPAATTNTTSPNLHMPDVLGLGHQNAAQQLADLGLHVNLLVVDLPKGDSRDGLVVSQLPAAGTPVDAGTNVFIGVGNVPKVVVPNVVGVYWEDAVGTLNDAGFVAHTVLDPQLSPDGNVLSQDPVGGTQAPTGSTVTITINDVCC
jgi:serine/threonine-protein kinase